MDERSYWNVRITIPVRFDEGRTYSQNEYFGVVASSLEDAIARVKREIPECTIWAVNHGGKIRYS